MSTSKVKLWNKVREETVTAPKWQPPNRLSNRFKKSRNKMDWTKIWSTIKVWTLQIIQRINSNWSNYRRVCHLVQSLYLFKSNRQRRERLLNFRIRWTLCRVVTKTFWMISDLIKIIMILKTSKNTSISLSIQTINNLKSQQRKESSKMATKPKSKSFPLKIAKKSSK